MNVVSRRVAVGMCAAVADGRETDANDLLKMYITEAMEAGHTPCDALMMLVKAAVGVAVGTEAGPEWFCQVAAGLAAKA